MAKKIGVVTGGRAEYGLLHPLLKAIDTEPTLTLCLIATGMHLSPEFGMTIDQILSDGWHVDEKVEMLVSSATNVGMAKSIGLGVVGFADAFKRLELDMLVVLGDRFEIFAATQAAFVLKIPVAHIHGGELTHGALDDTFRHCMTKMSHLHFTAHETYKKRVIQLGEAPENVFVVGPMILDVLKKIDFLNKEALENALEMQLKEKVFSITFHPETLTSESVSDQITVLLEALSDFQDISLVFSMANADPQGNIINRAIQDFCAARPEVAKMFPSLGQKRYLSLLKNATAVIGNSSSGVIEAPLLGVPTVNIGNRQLGRMDFDTVIHSDYDVKNIKNAIQNAIALKSRLPKKSFDAATDTVSQKIVDIIKSTDLSRITYKKFNDV